jgi:molybdate transport system substrate-binding protein
MKKIINYLAAAIFMLFILAMVGCSSSSSDTISQDNTTTQPSPSSVSSSKTTDLSGHALLIYCGAGMTKPFQEIADAFKAETGCEIQVTYANAGQIQSQINTAKEGDLFIAGTKEELKPVEGAVVSSKDLVKHTPVLAVKAGNPKKIKGLADLANPNISLVLGDSESTPIGKIADKALTDLGIFEKVNVMTRTNTAPAIFTALSAAECDAVIVWKENANGKKVEIVKTDDLDAYVKAVPAAVLTYSKDKEATTAFLTYLDTEVTKTIWIKYGYEMLK